MVCLQFVKEMLLQSGPLVLQYQRRCSYKVKLALPGRAGEVTVSPISTSTHTRHPWKMRWASAARSFRFLEDLCTCNRNVMAALTVWTLRPTPTSCYHTAGLEGPHCRGLTSCLQQPGAVETAALIGHYLEEKKRNRRSLRNLYSTWRIFHCQSCR